MKLRRNLALLLAFALQLLPLGRTFCTNPAVTSTFAVILRWTVGTAATLGAYDAVSGATTVYFTSPNTATGYVGQPFSFFITITNYGSDKGATFAATPLPAGLSVSTYDHPSAPKDVHGVISGTPTAAVNNMLINIAAAYPNQPTALTNLHLTILAASPPQVTNQPTGLTLTAGGNALLSVGASGSPPLIYQWRLNGGNLAGATTNSLALNKVRTNQAGSYVVVVTNNAGSITSSVASLTVNVPPPPIISLLPPGTNKFLFSFVPVVGLTNTILTNGTVGSGWTALTNIPPPTSANSITVTDNISGASRFYRLQVAP
ncbi:MAG: multidomain protein with s-layer y region, glug motif, ig motif, i-set domain [Pedosphaera sp.]|nr:multidomain protein with s-layer y region, glug motif, ig motif, i-set domain [Pedosphaera sp.]